LVFASCKDDVIPKPKGYLKLEYPEAIYKKYISDCPFEFEVNKLVKIETPSGRHHYCDVNLSYPGLKGKIHLTYIGVDEELLKLSLRDAQNLTQEHTQKAESIKPVLYENEVQNGYGMVYEIEGNAASPVQFYITDNKKHFLRGAVYFNVKPNYDSILPAAFYLKKDIQKLMESLQWKN
jgi:gliding motility-associated lipoprotein GldD